MPDDKTARPNLVEQYLAFCREMDAHGFTEHENNVVLARFGYREENIVSVRGKGKFDTPEDWKQAVEDARQRDLASYAELTEKHGFPDTRGLPLTQGHLTRLTHLMGKYPDADWDLLMQDQDQAMHRKPLPSEEPQSLRAMTLADVEELHRSIERWKVRFLASRQQRKELVTSGENPELLVGVIRSVEKYRELLQSRGVDTDALVAGDTSGADASMATPKQEAHIPQQVDVEPPTRSEPTDTTERTKETISPAEVALIMGVSYKTVLRHLETGQIPHGIKVGNRWVVQETQFSEWFKGVREVEETPAKVTRPPRETWDNGTFTPSF